MNKEEIGFNSAKREFNMNKEEKENSLLNKAIIIAVSAHKGQIDKGGQPYIFHSINVMMKMNTIEEKIVAVLHDVVEDTSITMGNLKEAGFGDNILIPLKLLTKSKGVNYMSYIKNIMANPVAKKVKLEDIKNNMDLTRILLPTQEDYERNSKYEKALEILDNI